MLERTESVPLLIKIAAPPNLLSTETVFEQYANAQYRITRDSQERNDIAAPLSLEVSEEKLHEVNECFATVDDNRGL